MPFIPNTPESLIARSDSKNPDTTCRGVTGSGRPCRRPLAASPSASPASSHMQVPKKQQLRVDDPADPESYCWQHKDQASLSAQSSPGPRTNTTPILEQRESLDTLFDRLGIVEAQQKKKKKSGKDGRTSSSGSNGHAGDKITQTASGNLEKPPRRKKKQSTFCCCFTIPTFEEERPARPKPKPLQSAPAAVGGSAKLPSGQFLAPSSAGPRPSVGNSSRRSSAMSQTSQYLSLIPPHASPQTASQLMAELAKPISQQDEAGYIYIFWLTPESQPKTPPVEAARDLLSPPPARGSGRQRRTSDVLQSYAGQGDGTSKTMLLKIGRANNVQRRLNEWTRQCGFNISLIRYYPYVSSTTPSTPRKMPHSHKVERLIHIELAGAGLRVSDKGNCESCGKAHKEWFEVDATRKGIETVDEAVRRWSDWDEGRA
ncbi:meiotically up-regulated gene 113-domain-containing protein [Truncatella angustata]|uniref:Meiotically up-regulated gene 113-domain-containing protein n=1 Tax=Truncatella angustata TaxID=152316 RepID=A0A9P8ZVG1_9PEZI|nr:meiotically up-regulated gene 113-domain-containing protein [Truncatella angustata]KAH6652575.1 meiotically up-regulated gene 113-domain-containing protein [Truncatella angustata]